MLETDLDIEYTFLDANIENVTAIIVAAGTSSRMDGIDKKMADLCGEPVIIRTLKAFNDVLDITNIVLVTREEDINQLQTMADEYNIHKLTDIVAGGKTREDSVYNGMKALGNDTGIVIVHDGARPLVSKKIIENVIDGACEYGACICAVPVKDTIKEVDSEKSVKYTPNRKYLYAAQTPQGFKQSLFYDAAHAANFEFSEFTDESSLFEKAGIPVAVVEGDYSNIKITTHEDLAVAEVLIKEKL